MSPVKLAYTVPEAAEATGISADLIGKAIRAGDLATASPTVAGRVISKHVIPADELQRWLMGRVA